MIAGELIAERFEVEGLAGSGGVGQVFRARDRVSGGAVAIKVLGPPSARDTERFAREARVLARLRHPAIVRYVGHGRTPGGEPYIAMEWLDGEDLAARLAREPLTPEESVAVVRRAAEALAVAHVHGIVHRDIKPSNLFLCDGRLESLKLLDFGLASLNDASRELTREGLVVGTLGYMAPEQAAGERGVDARTDVFALGCVLYRCLTGRPPFESDRVGAALRKVLHEEPPPMASLVTGVPPELEGLVRRMLAKCPAERPADGLEVAGLLGELLPKLAGSSGKPPAAPPAITHSERRVTCFVAVGMPGDWVSPPSEPLLVLFDLGAERIGRAREIALRLGGQLEVLADGGLLAVFGGAAPATDLAASAARCAIELRALLPTAPIALAMGRSEGTGARFGGAAVDVAARMLRAAPVPAGPNGEGRARHGPLPIRVEATCAGVLDGGFEIEADGGGHVLAGERPAAGEPRLLLGRPMPCVGRERELSALRAVFEECAGEHVARVALVTGPAGCGKSRVRGEIVRALSERGPIEIWTAAGHPARGAPPFALVAGLVGSAAQISAQDAAPARRQKLAALARRHLSPEQAERVVAWLGELVGVREEGPPWSRTAAALDPSEAASPPQRGPGAREEIAEPVRSPPASARGSGVRDEAPAGGEPLRRAWLDLLAAACASSPVILVLEDLHRGDAPSMALISLAARRLHDRPLLVLGFARPEAHELFPRLAREHAVQEIRLGELTPRASERLLRSVVGDAMEQRQIASIVRRAGGNPFHLVELGRAALAGRGGEVPETVLATVQARLLALDPAARRVLRAASVFGQRFHVAGVRALIGESETSDALSHWLDVLIDAEMIEHPNGAWDDEGEMAFRHALLCEAVHETLAEPDRRLGHRLAGAWLAESDQARPAAIARHFEIGGDLDLAAIWHLAAAEEAVGGADFSAAIAHAQSGVDCGPDRELAAALRSVQMLAFLMIGQPSRGEPHLREALALVPSGTEQWMRAAGVASLLAASLGRWDVVFEVGEAVLRVPPGEGALDGALSALASVTIALIREGLFDRARPFLERLVSARAGDDRPIARGWVEMALAYRAGWMEGDPWGQRQHALAAMSCLAMVRDLKNWGYATLHASSALVSMGAYAEAAAPLRELLARLDPAGAPPITVLARSQLAAALALAGHVSEARAEAAEAVRTAEPTRVAYLTVAARRSLVQALLVAGETGEAERAARPLEVVISPRGDAGEDGSRGPAGRPPRELRALPQVEAALTLAEVHIAAGRPAEALPLTSAAMRWLDASGGAGQVESALRRAHVEALAASGEREAAAAESERARARLLERAAKIDDPARRVSFLEVVPENRRTLRRSSPPLPPPKARSTVPGAGGSRSLQRAEGPCRHEGVRFTRGRSK